MPFALIGLSLAFQTKQTEFNWLSIIWVILCMVFARNAAMSFNRYIDRDIDASNPRTAIREIPAGLIKPKSAIQFVILNSILFIICSGLINSLTLALSPVALIVVLGYSLTKRFTAFCHLILGLGLSLAPIGAYLSIVESFDLAPILFSFIVLFWVSGFDIIYALQDRDFDISQKLKSIPVISGTKGAIAISIILHIFSASLVIISGFLINAGILYWIGSLLFIALLIKQHTVVKHNDLSRINLAFFTLNGVASVVFATFTILDIIL